MGAHTLCVKSKSMEMGVGSVMEDGMCSHDKYFSHFREIVTLSKEIIRIKKTLSQSEFAVELGIIPSLHMAARWCRGRTIRREAIALLYEYGSREGHWDSKTMAVMDSCVMELEEEDIDTEYIPEFARVRVLSITSDEEGGDWATVEYVRGSPRTGELPGRKRIRSPVDQQAISGRGSEESETGVAPYGEALMFPYGSADNGQRGGLFRSSSATPIGYLFNQPPVSK
jgi:transcriptional regulator with XRE-family HTH domain